MRRILPFRFQNKQGEHTLALVLGMVIAALQALDSRQVLRSEASCVCTLWVNVNSIRTIYLAKFHSLGAAPSTTILNDPTIQSAMIVYQGWQNSPQVH